MLSFLVIRDTTAGSSGHLYDTMAYKDNIAVYGYPKLDEGCKLTFTFTDNGVSVFEETPNYSSGCGYSHGIKGTGIYRKVSAEVPLPGCFHW